DAGGRAGMKRYWRLLTYLRPYLWPRFALAVACMLGFSAVDTALPLLIKYAFDYVFDRVLDPTALRHMSWQQLQQLVTISPEQLQHLRGALPYAVVGVLLAAFARGGFDFGASYLTDWIGQRVMTDLRNQLTAHMQRLDLAFFNRRRAGQIVSRVTADVALVRGLVTDAVTSIFEDLARLIGLMAMAVYFDWVLALVTVCLFPVAALPLRYFSSQLRQASRRMQEGIGRLNALLHENVQWNRVVKARGRRGARARAAGHSPAGGGSARGGRAARRARGARVPRRRLRLRTRRAGAARHRAAHPGRGGGGAGRHERRREEPARRPDPALL